MQGTTAENYPRGGGVIHQNMKKHSTDETNEKYVNNEILRGSKGPLDPMSSSGDQTRWM